MTVFTPMILARTNQNSMVLGTVQSVWAAGAIVGGIVMSAWGGFRRRIYGTLIFDLIGALAMIAAGLRPSVLLLAIAAFTFFVSMPISQSSLRSIWQSTVPLPLQGRVFATRDMLAIGAAPLAFLLMGPLADNIFEPLMATNGAFASTVGAWIGTGQGRGIALLFIVMGSCFLVINIAAWCNPNIRNLESKDK